MNLLSRCCHASVIISEDSKKRISYTCQKCKDHYCEVIEIKEVAME